MSNPKRLTTISVLLAVVFAFVICTGAAFGEVTTEQEQIEAESRLKTELEKKSEEAEKLEEKREEADRLKREKAQREREKAEARARAKAEAQELAKIDAAAKAQAKAEIADAKEDMMMKIGELEAKAKQQQEDLKEKLKTLKSEYKNSKAALDAEYKDRLSQVPAEDKESVETEYEGKLLNLQETYKADVASLKELKAEQKAEISQQKTVIENVFEEKAAKAKAKARRKSTIARLKDVEMPQDNTSKMAVRKVNIEGNILVSTAEIIKKMPLIWSSTGKPISETATENLHDFRVINDVILNPGESREVSARMIQGFTVYILSLYQQKNYAGVYVYVPKIAMTGANQLKDGVLLIEVLEAPVTKVSVTSYDADQNVKEKGYLRQSAVEEWSPVQPGGVANQKELDDFVNLLNQNPDRYVSATVTQGDEPHTLGVEYDVYEVSPWHWFIQLDNGGTRDRRWTPRIGLINTNLLGIDDSFSVIYQAPWDSQFNDEYSIYGSYDLPILGPKLRLRTYAGYSEFDVNPDSGNINFLGNGSFVGSELRYNVFQTEPQTPVLGDGWFFDVKGMAEYTRSKVTPSLFPQFFGSDVRFWMWGMGMELHRKDDMSNSSVGFDRWESWGGQSNGAAFNRARAGAQSDFTIYEFYARHSQFIDPNKIHRVSGNLRWIGSNERLVSAKMTTFGGMYSVRGYDEYEMVADGGILASFQYEYDLIAAEKAKMSPEELEQWENQQDKNPYEIKRAAPLVFVDYGRTSMRDVRRDLGESKHDELCSVGIGGLLDIGDNFSSAVYYGYPLIDTPDTRTGKGRVNVNFMLRW